MKLEQGSLACGCDGVGHEVTDRGDLHQFGPRARAKLSDRQLACSDAGAERLRSGADSGSRVQRPTAKSL